MVIVPNRNIKVAPRSNLGRTNIFRPFKNGLVYMDNFSSPQKGIPDLSRWKMTLGSTLTITCSNNQVNFNFPHSAAFPSSSLELKDSFQIPLSGIICGQCNVDWTTSSANEAICGMGITCGSPSTNYISASVNSRSSGGTYRLLIGGTASYDLSSAIPKGKDIKITYNVERKQIKFWYWDTSVSPNAWTQMGTTQTIANTIQGTCTAYFSGTDNVGWTGANPVIFKNFFFCRLFEDYITRYPIPYPI